MCSSQDRSAQTTPFDFVEENNGCAIVPIDVMLDMLDKVLGAASSTTAANITVPPDSFGTTNDTNCLDLEMNENIFHGPNETLFSLSTLKSLKNQLNPIMKSIQARSSDSVVGTSKDSNSKKYWLERLEQTIGLLQARIIKEELK